MKKLIGVVMSLALGLASPAFAATLGGKAAVGAAGGNGYTESLTWTQGASCGLTGVTCTSNVYSCVGTCTATAASGTTGCTSTSSTWLKIGSAVSGTAYTDSAPAGGVMSYCVTDLATGSGWSATESGPSNVFTQTFPVAPPSGVAGSHN